MVEQMQLVNRQILGNQFDSKFIVTYIAVSIYKLMFASIHNPYESTFQYNVCRVHFCTA